VDTLRLAFEVALVDLGLKLVLLVLGALVVRLWNARQRRLTTGTTRTVGGDGDYFEQERSRGYQ
jgi:hypothetical protein